MQRKAHEFLGRVSPSCSTSAVGALSGAPPPHPPGEGTLGPVSRGLPGCWPQRRSGRGWCSAINCVSPSAPSSDKVFAKCEFSHLTLFCPIFRQTLASRGPHSLVCLEEWASYGSPVAHGLKSPVSHTEPRWGPLASNESCLKKGRSLHTGAPACTAAAGTLNRY